MENHRIVYFFEKQALICLMLCNLIPVATWDWCVQFFSSFFEFLLSSIVCMFQEEVSYACDKRCEFDVADNMEGKIN